VNLELTDVQNGRSAYLPSMLMGPKPPAIVETIRKMPERRQYAIVGGSGFDAQSSPKRFSLRREVEITYSPVCIISLALNKALRMKPINN